MKEYIQKIKNLMEEAGLTDIDFLLHRTKPVIQKDGIRYEILTIYAPEEGEEELSLTTIPSYGFCLKHIQVTGDWRKTSWEKLTRIVESEIHRLYNEI